MRRKSSGTTMVASSWWNALVRQKCEESPATATPSIGSACAMSILVTKDGLLPTRFIGSCMAFIQDSMLTEVNPFLSHKPIENTQVLGIQVTATALQNRNKMAFWNIDV